MAKTFTPPLQEEIDYRFELMVETYIEDGDLLPALDDATLYQIFQDIENTDAGYGSWKREIQNWLIAKGVYLPRSKADLEQIQVSRGKKYDFKRGEVYYIFERAL